MKKVWKKKPTNHGQKDLSLETLESDTSPKKTIHKPLKRASKDGADAKTRWSSSQPVDDPLKADQVEERASMPVEEEDKDALQNVLEIFKI